MSKEILGTINAFVIDMDGVLYRGQERLPGARAFLETLQQHDVPYVLLTNNSTLTVAEYVDKLSHMGIDVRAEKIVTSAIATALHLTQRTEPGTPVYTIGMDGLDDALQEQGFVLTRDDPDYVVVGLDTHVTYTELSAATLAIRAGATFIGTNPDRTIPTEYGLEPGAGAILAAIEAATDVQPEIVGKPQTGVFDIVLEQLGTQSAETAIIGDRLETDILGGARAGLRTILMLTGVATTDQLATSEVKPDLIYDDLTQLLKSWDGARIGPQ